MFREHLDYNSEINYSFKLFLFGASLSKCLNIRKISLDDQV